MRHLKIVLFLSAILTSGLLYQCKSEQKEIIEKPPTAISKLTALDEIEPGSNEAFDKYLSTVEFGNFLSRYHFNPATYYRLTTDNGTVFYGVRVKPQDNPQSIKDYYLVVYPDGYKYKTLLFEQNIGEKMVNVSIFDPKDYSYIVGRDIPLEYDGEESKASDRTCYTENSTFLGCYFCGWGELTSDPVSYVACTLAWWACDAAISLHCLGVTSGVSPQNEK